MTQLYAMLYCQLFLLIERMCIRFIYLWRSSDGARHPLAMPDPPDCRLEGKYSKKDIDARS